MLFKFIVIVILQYIRVSNHHIVHLKLTQWCMSIISQKAGGKKGVIQVNFTF